MEKEPGRSSSPTCFSVFEEVFGVVLFFHSMKIAQLPTSVQTVVSFCAGGVPLAIAFFKKKKNFLVWLVLSVSFFISLCLFLSQKSTERSVIETATQTHSHNWNRSQTEKRLPLSASNSATDTASARASRAFAHSKKERL